MKSTLSALAVALVTAWTFVPAHAQILASAAGDYQAETVGSVMTPLTDTHGTGTWVYYAATANSETSPTGISSASTLYYENNSADGGGGQFYTISGTEGDGLQLPAVDNGKEFPDSPTPAPGYLEVHPDFGATSGVLEWTAGAGETGTLSLSFDLSRVGVGAVDRNPSSQGYDNFFILENGSEIYSDDDINIGDDTGLKTLTLSGVTVGTKVDFVVETYNNDFGFNLSYLSADISVPEPSTWALFLTGGLLLAFAGMRRQLSPAQARA